MICNPKLSCPIREQPFWGGVSNYKPHFSKFNCSYLCFGCQSVSIGPIESISLPRTEAGPIVYEKWGVNLRNFWTLPQENRPHKTLIYQVSYPSQRTDEDHLKSNPTRFPGQWYPCCFFWRGGQILDKESLSFLFSCSK